MKSNDIVNDMGTELVDIAATVKRKTRNPDTYDEFNDEDSYIIRITHQFADHTMIAFNYVYTGKLSPKVIQQYIDTSLHDDCDDCRLRYVMGAENENL